MVSLPNHLSLTTPWRAILVLLVLSAVLIGCSNSRPYLSPVDSHTQFVGKVPVHYSVKTGDSLYMIAMEFDLNYLELAKWNRIQPPYTIHRGQRLRLSPVKKIGVEKRVVKRSVQRDYYTVQRGDTLSEIANQFALQLHQLARWNGLKKPYTLHVGKRLQLNPAPQTAQKVTSKRLSSAKATRQKGTPRKSSPLSKSPSNALSSKGSASSRLRRPVSGKIAKRFSKKSGMTGVEFKGKRGDPVYAAADGKVVYSGTGLVRYGKLLIIKHNNNLLTAYAHNSQLKVSEGDVVKAGEQIAKMGQSGTDRVKLHFEVRKGGKPVDPMRYLSR